MISSSLIWRKLIMTALSPSIVFSLERMYLKEVEGIIFSLLVLNSLTLSFVFFCSVIALISWWQQVTWNEINIINCTATYFPHLWRLYNFHSFHSLSFYGGPPQGVDVAQALRELLPVLPGISTIFPEVISRLSSRVLARLIRDSFL